MNESVSHRSMSPPSSRAGFFGFSVIELLTVVGIITIVATLAIPVVSQVRESAKSTLCVNHLQQANLAFQRYISDMGNRIVTRRGGSRGSSNDIWGAELSGRGYLSESAREKGYQTLSGQDPRILQCPSGAVPPDYTSTNWAWYTYGLNIFTSGARSITENGTDLSVRPILTVEEPSRFPFLADSASGNDNFQYFRISAGTAGIALRHRQKGNVLFLDGHAEAVDRQRAQELGFPSIYDIPRR